MNPRVPSPRVLPLTILALAMLLVMKSVILVRAASPGSGQANPLAGAAVVPAALAASGEGAAPAPASVAAPAPPAGPPEGAKPSEPVPAAAQATAVGGADADTVSDNERALLVDLRRRREELDGREAALAARESVLAAAEHRLASRVGELEALQSRLEALETSRHEHDEANWRGLVKLYENMKPRDAAAIFNDLDMAVLLPVVDRMKEAKAAPVFAAMQPDKARQVTAELARMRVRANTPESGG